MKRNTILLILWTLMLLGLLLFPIQENVPLPRSFPYFDKVAHLGLFAITGFISIYGSRFLSAFRHRLLFGLVFGLALVLGTEFGQYFLPYRDLEFYDMLADLAGLFLGLFSYTFFYCWKLKLSETEKRH